MSLNFSRVDLCRPIVDGVHRVDEPTSGTPDCSRLGMLRLSSRLIVDGAHRVSDIICRIDKPARRKIPATAPVRTGSGNGGR